MIAETEVKETSLITAFVAFLGAAVLFSTTATNFAARPTDISALRVLDGQVPYRDFWTIYAPGSIYVTAAAFAVFGRNLIVSNLLGIFVSSLAVAVYHRVVARVAPGFAAFASAFLLAAAFYNTGYHLGLTTFPPAILFLLLGVGKLADFAEDGKRPKLLLTGILFGLCTLFKHDVGAYACLAGAITLVFAPLTSQHSTIRSRAGLIMLLAASVLAMILPFMATFLFLAKKDLVQDLIVFPLRDFPWAREESFPGIVPEADPRGGLFTVRGYMIWAICNFPLFTTLISLPFLWRIRKRFARSQAALVVFSIAAFPFFWYAAHVQINTHPNTLTALAALLGSAAWVRRSFRPRPLAAAIVIIWGLVLLAEPVYKLQQQVRLGLKGVNLPHLVGIRAEASQTISIQKLAQSMEHAAPPDRPILVLSSRNDVLIYCEGAPYWLSDRKIVTRHHELHPGVTDTETVQQEMLHDISEGALPVVVREHRFSNSVLDQAKISLQQRLPVGATLLDEWVKNNYRGGSAFGMYEVMIPLR